MRAWLARAIDGEEARERHALMAVAFAVMDLPLTAALWILGATAEQLLTLTAVVWLGVLCLWVERLKNALTLTYAIAFVPVATCVLSSWYAEPHGDVFLTLIMGAAGLTPLHNRIHTVVSTWLAATLGWAVTLGPRGTSGVWAVVLYSWCYGIVATILYLKAQRMRRLQVDLKAQAQRAEAASRAKSQFLAAMSHELRTPLNGVIGMTEIALRSPLTVEQRDSLETIRSSADWLLGTITTVLEFARAQSDRMAIQNAPWHPRALVEELAVLLAPAAHQKGLELISEVDDAVPDEVLGDAARVRQVLSILVGNAIKFTDAGFVAVQLTYQAQTGLSFAVSDTGIGIAAADQASLFEAFSRVDGSLSRRGTGLGLALAREVVTHLGGAMALTSELGHGSTFRFFIPAPSTGAGRAKGRALEGESCAVLSAFPVARGALERLLTAEGAIITDSAQASLVVIDVPVREPLAWLASLRPVSARAVALVAEGAHLGGELKRHGLVATVNKARPRPLIDALAKARSVPTPVPALEAGASLLQLPASPRASATATTTLCSALVVEDNPVNAKVLVRLLERLGVRCEVVVDGVEALQRASEQHFEVVFMDINMPRMDGLEATRQLRARGQTQPIIAVTARVSAEDEDECLAAGMNAYLAKPVNVARLEQVLHQTLPRLRSARN